MTRSGGAPAAGSSSPRAAPRPLGGRPRALPAPPPPAGAAQPSVGAAAVRGSPTRSTTTPATPSATGSTTAERIVASVATATRSARGWASSPTPAVLARPSTPSRRTSTTRPPMWPRRCRCSTSRRTLPGRAALAAAAASVRGGAAAAGLAGTGSTTTISSARRRRRRQAAAGASEGSSRRKSTTSSRPHLQGWAAAPRLAAGTAEGAEAAPTRRPDAPRWTRPRW
mmetsp:Transcript_24179/g.91257  ORF Transcript_24179/g.91257 Transcript_24179/m.91257 type:complete len:226 (-) Transcript_24179:815-1492(-)